MPCSPDRAVLVLWALCTDTSRFPAPFDAGRGDLAAIGTGFEGKTPAPVPWLPGPGVTDLN